MKHEPTGHEVAGDIASLTTSKVQQSPRRLVLSLVAVLALFGGYLALRSPDRDQTLPPPEIPEEEETTQTTATSLVSTTDIECDVDQLVGSLSGGLERLSRSSGTLRSVVTLAEVSPHVVRGQLLEANARDGGTRILVKPRQIRNKPGVDPILRLDSLWTPATPPQQGALRGNFVAFLTGKQVEAGWLTRFDGLWVGCDDVSPARSVLANAALIEPITLNELWSANSQAQPLFPLFNEGGAAIVEVFGPDGSRFRLSLPEHLAEGLVQTSTVTPQAPVQIVGNEVSISIAYGFCPGAEEFEATLNPLGSMVWIGPDGAGACRESDQIRMSVEADWQGREADLQLLDVRPMSVGPIYGSGFVRRDPFGIEEWGPLRFGGENSVVVNQTSHTAVTAVNSATLEEEWTLDPGGFDTTMHYGPGDGLYLNLGGGPFLHLDPATGEERWRIDRDPAEHFSDFTRDLLSSSFRNEGDQTAPLLRRIDAEQGTVLWTARGQENTEWHGEPTVMNDLVMVTDGVSFRGFSYESGEPLWSSDLGDPTAAFAAGPIAVVEVDTGPVLIVSTFGGKFIRVDPTNGQPLWARSVQSGLLGGTDHAEGGRLAVDIATPSGSILLDPETGKILAPESTSFECPATWPTERFVPPELWPAAPNFANKAWYGTDELWTVVPMDNIMSIWWSANFTDAAAEPQPELEVIYERLDEPAELVELPSPATNSFTEETGLLMAAGLAPRESGCWKATATYKGTTLEVVWEQ